MLRRCGQYYDQLRVKLKSVPAPTLSHWGERSLGCSFSRAERTAAAKHKFCDSQAECLERVDLRRSSAVGTSSGYASAGIVRNFSEL